MIPVSTFKVEYGCRPGILMVKMGQEGHYSGSRVILSGFYNLGFNVNVGPLFFTPGEVADLATNSDVHVIGVSYQAAGHLSLFPELRDKLRTRRRRRRTRRGGGERGVRGIRGRGRGGRRYGGGGGGDHTNLGSRFSPGKRGEQRRQREQVLQCYIWSRDSN